MSKPPFFIDNIAFAKSHEKLHGDLTLNDCSRLAELLSEQRGNSESVQDQIHFQLEGHINSARQPQLLLAIQADLTVTCQRCLEPMPLTIDLEYKYLISNVESDDLDENDDIDLQEPNANMDLVALIEDEIIMALPIAPTHTEDCGPQVTQSGEKPNPFAVLKGLIKP